jgi:hypothetical protein
MITPTRIMNPLHITFDIVFLIGFLILLFVKRRHMTLLFGFAGGIIYFLVDWGIFYKIMGTRTILINGVNMSEAGKILFLLWLSMSYGMTNFAWICLWLKRDEYLKEFSIYILVGWVAIAISATDLGANLSQIQLSRGTGIFHAVMALYLILSYCTVVVFNLVNKKGTKLPILWMLAIGILVQFGWEAALLLGSVRSAGYSPFEAIRTLVVNSLIETNPAVPSILV